MGGSSQADSKTTTQVLTPEQQSLVGLSMPEWQSFASGHQSLPGSAGVAQFDPLQTQGQDQVLGSTGTQRGIVGNAAAGNEYLTSGAALDPSSNPALANYISTATAPIFKNLNRNTLPQLAADASTGSGGVSANFGGSRQGIAQGLATENAFDAAGNTAANIANSGYNSGLSAMLQSIGQSPLIAAGQTIPGTTTSTVGDIRQQQAQQNLSADTAAKQFADWLPLLKAQMLTQGASGLPGGSTTAVGTGNTDANPISQLIGGASAAGGLAGGLSKLLPFLMAA
jgi:hypothetical protein